MGTSPATAAGVAQNGVVGEVPAANTPHILDGTVHDIAQVGNRIVVAGNFTAGPAVPGQRRRRGEPRVRLRVRPGDRADRPGLRPGRQQRRHGPIQAGPNNTVYIGGVFNTVNGQTGTGVRRLVQLSMATGDRVAGFTTPNINAGVNDLALVGTRLYVGGVFSLVARQPHGGLVALNATTGARTTYMGVDVTVNHNWPDRGGVGHDHAQAPVGVDKFDITPDGTRMIAIGNFRQADGLVRDQAVLINLGTTAASVAPNWRTQRLRGDLLLLGLRLLRPRRAVLAGRLLLRHRHLGRRQPGHAAATRSAAWRPPRPATTCSRPGRRSPAATRCSRSRSPAPRSTPAATSAG